MKTEFLSVISFAVVAIAAASSLDRPAYGFSASADSLIKEYEDNEVAADQKYKGQVVNVGGRSGRVGKTDNGTPYLVVYGTSSGEYGGEILCLFADARRIATIKPGALVGIKGVVVGRRHGSIIMENCVP